MSSAAVAVLYSLATITCWGTVNVVIKNLTNNLGEKSTLYYRGMFSAISSCLLLLAFLNESTFNITYIFYGAFLATFSYIGFYYLVRGLTVGKVGIVVPLN
ncbi:hypothetical protein KC980_03300, partial [candidate division WWE3 bacterium]|nr:hypothetical protein [candidate division WWE3 bacterium]